MIQETIGDKLKSFGGHLECHICGNRRALGNIGAKIAKGWPMCCGETMLWITARQLKELETQT